MKRLLLLLATACLTGCNLNVAQPENRPTDPATETFDPSLVTLGVDIPSMTKTPSGAYYKELKLGTGAALTGQPFVLFTFNGFVKTGALFAAGTQQFPIPLSNLVYGLQEGMQGMKVGGVRLVVVPSALGFGPQVNPGVPANSTLIYKIQLDDLP
jgi:FKBP-type peptidyl-prolyl cis-trans isomerase FkpA